jgi:AcrR family transcriptional regulator/ferredoxin
MNVRLILSMGRIAGVTAAETRERLLRAAADAFAERGYDGTRVADIAAAAGVSNGALYAHFTSKADLLVDALRTHGRRLLADLFATDPSRSIMDLLLVIGRWLPRRRDARGYLIVEALVAARRDRDVAEPMRAYIGERADWLAGLMHAAQAGGELDRALSPDALAHFCLLLAMGSALVPPDLHAVDDGEWAALLSRLVTALAPASATTQTGQRHDTDGSSTVKVRIDSERCQGHGRCYDLAPSLFGDDDEGYGMVLGDGSVPPGLEHDARLAALNCPEHAIDIEEA